MTNSSNRDRCWNKARTTWLEARRSRIRELNDKFRKTLSGGYVTITIGVKSHGLSFVAEVTQAVQAFDSFSESNDPHTEHDMAAFECRGQRLFWKIDYYDKQLEFGSPDAADPDVTIRVLTIMLASEY